MPVAIQGHVHSRAIQGQFREQCSGGLWAVKRWEKAPAGKDTHGCRWGLTNGPHSGDGLVKTTLGVLSCWGLKILCVCLAEFYFFFPSNLSLSL